MSFLRKMTICVTALAILTGTASAGSSQSGVTLHPEDLIQSFSEKVEQALAQRGAHVALVARVGRNPDDLPDGVQFTHAAFWVYSEFVEKDGSTRRGYQVFNLYQRAKDPWTSDLVRDLPYDFFAAGAVLEAGVAIPDPRLQAKLLKVLTGPANEKLHNPRYSLLSNPDNNQYQNCTEHSLNVLFAALYGTDDMTRLKANISAHYEAQPIKLSPLKRVLGPVFVRGVETDDHGRRIETTTFTSIARFMAKHGLISEALRIRRTDTLPLRGLPAAITDWPT